MTDLSSAIADYLKVRRVLGHKMELAERLLGQFCIYYEQDGATHITTDLAVAWATLPVDASAGWWAQRLGVVRGFAAWLQTLEPDTEVPPPDLLTGRFGRVVPYLYSDASDRGGDQARPRRCVCRRRTRPGDQHQVREVQRGPPAPQFGRSACGLRAAARPPVPGAGRQQFLREHAGDQAALLGDSADLQETGRTGRPSTSFPAMPATHS